MANFTDAQVAAYIRDNNLSPEQAAQAASAFGVSSSQLASAQNLLSSGAPSVEQASQTYAAQVADRPDLVAQNLAFYNPAAQPDFSTAAPLAGPPAQLATAPTWDYEKYLQSLKTPGENYSRALGQLSAQSPEMAKGALSIYDQIKQQQQAGTQSAWAKGQFADTDAAAADFALRLSEAGLSSLYDLGQRQVEREIEGESGPIRVTDFEYFNKATGEALKDWDRLASSGPLDLNYRVEFQNGMPIPYTAKKASDWVEFREEALKPALSLASLAFPAIAPYVAAGNAINAAQKGDWGTAIVSGLTAMGGISGLPTEVAEGLKTAKSAASVLNAIEKGNPIAIANALSQTDVGKQLIGTEIGGGITIGNVLDTAKIAAAVDNGQYAEALNYAGSLTNNPNLMVAGSAANVIKAIDSGQPFAIANALSQLHGAVAKASPPSGGITDRVYDDAMVQSGADAFLRAKEAGASDEDAYAAAEAVVTPVADVPPSTATITTPQDLGEFAGLDQAIDTQKAASTVNIGNAEADTPEEAAALARTRNPDARSFTFGGREYTFGASSADIDRVTREAKLSEIRDAGSFNEAYRLARESKDLLGPDQTFEWRGQKFSTATAEEQKAKEPVFTPTVRDYVANKLADQASDPNFNPQDLSSASLKRYVEAYANANPAQQKAMLESFDGATYGVIDAMLKETAAVNPQGTVVNKAPSTAKEELKAFEKPLISTAIDVVKVAGNLAAADIAGVGTRAAEFVSSVLGGDGETLREVQDLLVNKKDQQMSKLVGNEKAVAAGLASGIESAASFIVGGPVMPVVTIGSVVANNTWQEGATKWIDSKGNAYDSKEEARSYGVTDVRQLTPQENGMRTAAMTAIEVAGEMLGIPGMKQIMKGIPITGSVDKIIDSVKTLGKGLAKEEATELLTTVAQFSTDKFASFGLGQNSTFEDFKGALADTVIATAAAVGGSSAIATSASSVNNAIDRATQGQFDASPIVPAGVNPSEVGSLLERGSDFAKLPADYFLGSNPITQEQADFLKVDKAEQSMMDKIRNQAAGVVLSISAAVSAPAATIDFSAPTQEVTQTIQSELGGKIAGGIPTFDAVSQALASGQNANAVISGAISSSISSGQSVESAVTQTVESAINAGAPVSQTVASSVSSAVSSQIASNVPASQAISASIASAVSAVAQESATSATSQSSQAALAIESSVSSAIQSAQQNNVPIDVAIQSAVESAVAAAAVNSISIEQAVQSAVQSAIQTANANNVAQSVAASIAVNAAINTAAANGLNVAQVTQVANATVAGAGPDVGMPTTPESSEEIAAITAPTTPAEPVGAQPAVKTTAAPKAAAPQAVGTAGLAGGMGAMLPSSFEMDETFLPSRETQKAIDPLARVMQAQAELEKTAMMQQIDPRLLSVLQQRIAPEQQQAQQQQFDKDIGALSRLLSGQPANTSDYYSYGSEDSIDSILGGQAANFKEGGYVEPLKAAEGGMALPLLAKSGGALSHYGGREDYKDGKHVAGEGDGQSDDIPAWLADGEFVFPADVVSALGNGSTKAGTDKLYEMMHSIRERARSKGPKDLPPPALKSPLDYLKSSKRS